MTAQKRGNGNSVTNSAKDLARDAKNTADHAHETQWVDALVRVGYFARGIVYGMIGYLAIQAIFTGRGSITDQKGVLSAIAAQPLGKWVLIVVAVGLVGLTIWGFLRAIADPYHKGSDAKGIVARLGYAVSGISYGALFASALNLITGVGQQGSGSSQSAQNAAAGIMSKSWGPWLVGLVGLVLMGVGVVRILAGYRAKFNERLKRYEMSAAQRRWAVRLGRIGYIAIGIVFLIIGGLAVWAATSLDPQKVGGLDGALLFLSREPYGQFLLGVVALGLIAYAVYSMMGALWFRIKEL